MQEKTRSRIDKKIMSAHRYLPSDNYSQSILKSRASLYSQPDKVDDNKVHTPYVCIKLTNGDYYGIAFSDILEVISVQSITPLPNMVPYVTGVINRRGMLLAIIDLTKFFNLPNPTHTSNMVIIVNHEQQSVGILAHEIVGNFEFDPEKLTPPLKDISLDPQYFVGLDQESIPILNFKVLLGKFNPSATV